MFFKLFICNFSLLIQKVQNYSNTAIPSLMSDLSVSVLFL